MTEHIWSNTANLLRRGRHTRLPDIRQSESTECGLACIAMISGYHGHMVDLANLRQRFPNSLQGTTLHQLMGIGMSLGLASRALRVDLEDISSLQIPCILHWDMDHFVVLREVGRQGVVLHDPAHGIRRMRLAQCAAHFTGVALEMTPTPQFTRKRAKPPISLRKLAGKVKGLTQGLVHIFALAILLEALALITPQFMQITVDQVLADGDRDLLALIGIAFIALLLVQAGIGAVRTWVVTWLGSHFTLSWTGNIFQHLLRLPQSYFIKRHLGDIISRFSAVATIQQTLSTQFVSVVLDGLMSVLTLVLLFVYSPLLATCTVSAIVIYGLLRVLYFHVLMEANLSQIMVNARQQSVFMESVRGVQTIRLFGQSAAQTSRYLNATADSLNMAIEVQRLNLVFGTLSNLTNGAQRVTTLWLGGWLGLKGGFSAGMLMAFIAYADQFSMRSTALVDYLIQLRLL
ncbi:MAG: Lactococcin-G-processing and transport ATP-binding protein LagD [Burkholderia gladioli]|nr:MAG: Lactococcin-G-processing and transport ATP-binding protein LagD [Burkholderia gladioli]